MSFAMLLEMIPARSLANCISSLSCHIYKAKKTQHRIDVLRSVFELNVMSSASRSCLLYTQILLAADPR